MSVKASSKRQVEDLAKYQLERPWYTQKDYKYKLKSTSWLENAGRARTHARTDGQREHVIPSVPPIEWAGMVRYGAYRMEVISMLSSRHKIGHFGDGSSQRISLLSTEKKQTQQN